MNCYTTKLLRHIVLEKLLLHFSWDEISQNKIFICMIKAFVMWIKCTSPPPPAPYSSSPSPYSSSSSGPLLLQSQTLLLLLWPPTLCGSPSPPPPSGSVLSPSERALLPQTQTPQGQTWNLLEGKRWVTRKPAKASIHNHSWWITGIILL